MRVPSVYPDPSSVLALSGDRCKQNVPYSPVYEVLCFASGNVTTRVGHKRKVHPGEWHFVLRALSCTENGLQRKGAHKKMRGGFSIVSVGLDTPKMWANFWNARIFFTGEYGRIEAGGKHLGSTREVEQTAV